ncbi:MAG: polysaccharide deacetylase family protein, partial [Clostridia bacterium]|nr:polysaccharide deacetylase family protein [Clostridia bacterium]
MENKRPLKTIYTCFPGGKHKVLTMSYDDGREFDRRLISIFNKYGIKGTFHLNSGLMDVDETRIQLDEVKELYKGHEVSCHTLTHPTIERCPLSQVVQQV